MDLLKYYFSGNRRTNVMRIADDLKPHNKETYEKLKEVLKTNNRTCAIQPTGSGKSYLILKLIEDYAVQNRDIIVIEPQKYIFNQLQKKMNKYELPVEKVKFVTYSALGKLDEEKVNQFISPNLVLVDEMHRAGAPKWGNGLQKMFDFFPKDCKYIGFSATPIRFLDGKRNMAEELFDGCIASEIGLADAILDRILPLPRYIAGLYTYENEVNAITRKIQKSYNTDEEKAKLLEEVANMKKNLDKSKGISSIFKKYINQDKGKYIAFCRNITHLKKMKSCLIEWFSEAGISVNLYEVHCKNPKNDKQFDEFMNDDKLAVCLSVAILAEGVHGIDGVILLRDTISPNLYYQQIGRAFAVDMDTVPIIFDLVANCESIMGCNLKNDLLDAVVKRDENKNKKSDTNDSKKDLGDNNYGGNNKKEIKKDDIESFFIFDHVIDAVNAFREIEGRIIGNNQHWTSKDLNILIKYYPSKGTKICNLLSQKRSNNAIIEMAKKLNLGYENNRKWSKKDKEFLLDNYNRLSIEEISKIMNRTQLSLKNMARKLNLAKSNLKKSDFNKWNNKEIELLKEFYPLEGKKAAFKLQYKTEKQCLTKAHDLKIKYVGYKTSKYKFVHWSKYEKKWKVSFKVNGKSMRFGTFDSEEEAAKVAIEKAKEYGKNI